MIKHFDTIVIGVGGMGSSACYHLAKRGVKVLGLEQYSLGHEHGSSHGETRIIRKAYFEHPNYIPLLHRAYNLWAILQHEYHQNLFVHNGLMMYGNPEKSSVYQGTLQSSKMHNILVETLSYDECIHRFPMFQPERSMKGVYESGAGYLHVEQCVLAHAEIAQTLGAVIHENETILHYNSTDSHIIVMTNKGTYHSDKLIITGGPWSVHLLKDLGVSLKLYRLIQYWFKASDVFENTPCFAFHTDHGFYYGFPRLDGKTIKIASHFDKQLIQHPSQKTLQKVPENELRSMQDFIQKFIPQATTHLDRFSPCIYTITPDEHFIIDCHPMNKRISFAAGFSGHGFKFSSVVGEILADLSTEGHTNHPADFLKLRPSIYN